MNLVQISEHNASMVKKGIIISNGSRWLHAKLFSFSKDIRANGCKALLASQVDAWVGLTMHANWNFAGTFVELRIPGDGKPRIPEVLLILADVECKGWKNLTAEYLY